MKSNTVVPEKQTDGTLEPMLSVSIEMERSYGSVTANPNQSEAIDVIGSEVEAHAKSTNMSSEPELMGVVVASATSGLVLDDGNQDNNHDNHDNQSVSKEGELKESMGLFHTVALAVGGIIGSGIFVSPNMVVQKTGSMGVSIMVWIFAGILTTFGALCFGELGAMFPKSGGEYQYLRIAYGRLAAFANLWILLIVNSMGCAVMALTFATYILILVVEDSHPHFDVIKKGIAFSALVAVTVICISSTRSSLWVQSTFTVLKVSALFFLLTLAFTYIVQGKIENLSSGFDNTNMNLGDWSEATLSAVWAYNGWNCINIVASEVKNPKKNLPRALFITGTAVTLIYVLVNISYHTIMSTEELKQSQSVAVVAAEKFFASFGPQAVTFGRYFFGVSVAVSTFGSLLATILYVSRVPYAGALESMLPKFLSLVSTKNNSPVTALILMAILSGVCILPSNISYLIQYAMYLSWLFWGLCFVAVIYLRWKIPDVPRPFKVPIFVPIMATVFAAYLAVGPFVNNPVSSSMWILVTVASIPVFYGYVDKDETCHKGMDQLHKMLSHYLATEAESTLE